jgi:hypothetical protein
MDTFTLAGIPFLPSNRIFKPASNCVRRLRIASSATLLLAEFCRSPAHKNPEILPSKPASLCDARKLQLD